MLQLPKDRKGSERMLERRPVLSTLEPYVPGKSAKEVAKEYGITDVTVLSANENPLGPSPKAVAAMERSLWQVNRYPEGGSASLRHALATLKQVSPTELIFGNGGDEVLKLIAEAFIEPEDEAIVPTPTFSTYEAVVKLMAGVVRGVPLRNWEMDLEAMALAIGPKTKIVFLCNPNNPTATYIKNKEIESFLLTVPDHVLVVIDEAYAEFVAKEDLSKRRPWYERFANVISVHTFSKIYGLAGLRIGYAMATDAMIQNLERVREPFSVNVLAQVGAEAALFDTEHLQQTSHTVQSGRQQLRRGLVALGLFVVPSQTNFLLFDVGRDAKEVVGQLLKEGVAVRAGTSFGLPTMIRVSVGTTLENERFLLAIKRILTTE